jgi:hypothetical protein
LGSIYEYNIEHKIRWRAMGPVSATRSPTFRLSLHDHGGRCLEKAGGAARRASAGRHRDHHRGFDPGDIGEVLHVGYQDANWSRLRALLEDPSTKGKGIERSQWWQGPNVQEQEGTV